MFPFLPALSRRGRIAALALAGLATLASGMAAPAAADPISVVVDRAKVMHISKPANVVIVGNPAIADATIQDTQTLIITGRSFGTTNLIVLDDKGQTIADEVLTVEPSNDQVVTVYRRAMRETLSCTPDCSPVLSLGDNAQVFSATNAQISAARELADTAAQR
jgi:Flp pilus assembly secretin CpaC